MVQTLEQGDIFGRIGKSLGQGFGEQAERSRLASSLERMQGQGGTPLSQTAGLLRSGATPEQINQFLPLLQEQQARREFAERGEPIAGIPASQQQNLIAQERITPSGEVPVIGNKSVREGPTELGKEFQPLSGTTEALEGRARQLMASQPALYRDPQKALARAQTEFQNQQAVLGEAEKEFDSALQKRLQKYGAVELDQSIIGDMRQDYLRQVQALAASGKMSPSKAADKVSADLLDFAKARSNLSTATIPSLLGFGLSGKDAQAKLKAIRKEYESNDRLELFEDDLINKIGLSPGVASFLAFPISGNKEIAEYTNDTKKRFSLSPFQGGLVKGIQEKGGKGTKKRTEQDIGNFVSKNLKESDSLNSIATAFNAKGYDPQQILNQIQKNWDEGKLSLSKRQQRDLQKRTHYRAKLKDIAYFSGTGLNPQEIVP